MYLKFVKKLSALHTLFGLHKFNPLGNNFDLERVGWHGREMFY